MSVNIGLLKFFSRWPNTPARGPTTAPSACRPFWRDRDVHVAANPASTSRQDAKIVNPGMIRYLDEGSIVE
jgi:hypothetical protein